MLLLLLLLLRYCRSPRAAWTPTRAASRGRSSERGAPPSWAETAGVSTLPSTLPHFHTSLPSIVSGNGSSGGSRWRAVRIVRGHPHFRPHFHASTLPHFLTLHRSGNSGIPAAPPPAVVLTTHSMEEAEVLADDVIVLAEGHVAAAGKRLDGEWAVRACACVAHTHERGGVLERWLCGAHTRLHQPFPVRPLHALQALRWASRLVPTRVVAPCRAHARLRGTPLARSRMLAHRRHQAAGRQLVTHKTHTLQARRCS
jgi:hypothetical protein